MGTLRHGLGTSSLAQAALDFGSSPCPVSMKFHSDSDIVQLSHAFVGVRATRQGEIRVTKTFQKRISPFRKDFECRTISRGSHGRCSMQEAGRVPSYTIVLSRLGLLFSQQRPAIRSESGYGSLKHRPHEPSTGSEFSPPRHLDCRVAVVVLWLHTQLTQD